MQNQLHIPVLLNQVKAILDPTKGDSYLDLTAGMGGHAREILSQSKNYEQSVLVDRDEFAINQLQDLSAKGVRIIRSDFLNAAKELLAEGKKFDCILIDLGVSSPQLDQANRGFSFMKEANLDMRMDNRQELSAYHVINKYSEKDLAEIINLYGEENIKRARKIANGIIQNRPINTTTELADVVLSSIGGKRGKTHPATKTFQAIRIEVNQELKQIQETLKIIPYMLNPGGRLAIISFHSLEDRIVKQFFQNEFKMGLLSSLAPITKKPILGAIEDVSNPRSRSAVLRGALKK